MSMMNYIDFLEFIIAKFLSDSSRNEIFNYRVILNLIIRLLIYFCWIYLIHPNNYYNDDFAFTAALWLIYDLQVFLDLEYIKGNKLSLYRRQRSYKIINILCNIVIFYYLYQKELDSNMLIPMLVLLSIDFTINCIELGNYCWRKNDISLDEHEEGDPDTEDGGLKLFIFSCLIGQIYAIYSLKQASDYGNSLILKEEVNDDESQDVPFVCGQAAIILDIIGEFTTTILLLYLLCKTETPLFSPWKHKNILLFVYGLLVGMMNFFAIFLIGLLALIYLMCKLISCDSRNTVTVTETVVVTENVEVTKSVEVQNISMEPTVPGWYGD